MPDIIEGIKPTRSELLKVKKRLELADKGRRLLKEKRDALFQELQKAVSRLRIKRKEVREQLSAGYRAQTKAEMVMGTEEVREISLTTARELPIHLEKNFVMGVAVPSITPEWKDLTVLQHGYGMIGTSVTVDETVQRMELGLKSVIELAEIEETVVRLALEMQKTKRRVNALDYVILPRYQNTLKYIRMRLDEIERENFIRLKKVKSLLEKRKEAFA